MNAIPAHPWLRIEHALRAAIGDRMTYGASDERDGALAAVIEKRQQIEPSAWSLFSRSSPGENPSQN